MATRRRVARVGLRTCSIMTTPSRNCGEQTLTTTTHEASITWLAGVGGSSGTPGVGARSAAVAPLAARPSVKPAST